MKGIALLCIVIMILLCWWLVQARTENFSSMLGSRIHVVISKDGKALSYSYQQPSGDGIYGCATVPCPNKNVTDGLFESDQLTCWSCCNYD
jgi:hypothetical protein